MNIKQLVIGARLDAAVHVTLCVILAGLVACSANSGPGSNNSSLNTANGASGQNLPVVALTINPQSIKEGGIAMATWSSSGATACTGGGDWSGSMALSNSSGQAIGPASQSGTYAYSLTCTGAGGSATATQSLSVGTVPAPGITFVMSPAQIRPGDATTLIWSTTNATGCAGSGGTGSDGWAATQPISDMQGFSTGAINTAGSYTYTLTCTGPGGSTSQASVLTVASSAPAAPPAITFAATPTFLQPGGSTTLNWAVTGATACTASGGTGSDQWSGSMVSSSNGLTIGPLNTTGNFTYTLTCTGSGGTSSQGVEVSVNAAPSLITLSMDVAPTQIVAGSAATLSWTTTNASACTASGSWSGAQPVQGSGFSVGTIIVPGIYTYVLTCTGSGGAASAVGSAQLTVLAAPPVITTLTAAPSSVAPGGTVTLAWSSVGTSGTNPCTAGGTGGWSGAQLASSTGTNVVAPATAGSYTYTLACSGAGGTSTLASATVTVMPPPAGAVINSFMASPTTLTAGGTSTLSWSVSNATACTPTGGTGADGWTSATISVAGNPATGSFTTSALGAGTYTYTLSCTGAGGNATQNIAINVTATPQLPVIDSFAATPTALQTGNNVTLAWSTTNASACTGSGGSSGDGWAGITLSGGSLPNGSLSVGPLNTAGSYSYGLLCTGAGGSSLPSAVTVTVTATPPPPVVTSFTATPVNVLSGSSTTLAWTSSGTSSCTATNPTGGGWTTGTVPTSNVSGTAVTPTAAGIYTYTLTCAGATGSSPANTSSAVTVTVAANPPPSIGSFTATPATVQTGQATTLSWSTSNATSCSASGGTGSDGWSGTLATASAGTSVGPFTSAGSYTYTLTCTGSGGSANSTVVVTAVSPPPAASIAGLTVVPAIITLGQSNTISWSSTNATSCTAGGTAGWSGTVGTSSAGAIFTPGSTGTSTYTLTCTGPGGTSGTQTASVTVNAVVPSQPSVSLNINGGATAQVVPGAAPVLTWSSTNSSSCSATGGATADGWISAVITADTSGSTTLGAISVPGIYQYTLTCTGTGGTSTATVTLTVIAGANAMCDPDVLPLYTWLLTPAATSASGSYTTAVSLLCNPPLLGALCGVVNPGNMIDSNKSNFETMYAVLSLGTTLTTTIMDSETFPAGRTAGFILTGNNSLLDATVLSSISVSTLNCISGTCTAEESISGNLLSLQVAGLLSVNNTAGYVSFTTTKPFNAVQLTIKSLASVASSYNVYGACVSLQ